MGSRCGFIVVRPPAYHSQLRFLSREGDSCYHGISGTMYNYIRSFLRDRSMQVRWKGAMSAIKSVSMPVPHGSVIAPLLFNIMVHDVDTVAKEKVVVTMYADHLAIWMHGDLHQTFPHNQPECEAQHEAFPGSCGQFYEGKWIRPLFPENWVRPIPHQHLRTRRCTSK